MSPRSRTLTVGGVLLAVLVAGLLVGFLALGDDDQSSGTTTTPSVTTSAPPSDPRAQVEQAYLHAWDVWADALTSLDTVRLSVDQRDRVVVLRPDADRLVLPLLVRHLSGDEL